MEHLFSQPGQTIAAGDTPFDLISARLPTTFLLTPTVERLKTVRCVRGVMVPETALDTADELPKICSAPLAKATDGNAHKRKFANLVPQVPRIVSVWAEEQKDQ